MEIRAALIGGALLLAFAGAALPGGAVAEESPASTIGADQLHSRGITGRGVTVAVALATAEQTARSWRGVDGRQRLLAVFEAEPTPPGRAAAGAPAGWLEAMLSNRRDADGRFEGVAPDADFVLLRASGPEGLARAVGWSLANRDRYGIRVLVLPSVGAAAGPARAVPGWAALRRAALEAWTAGIVVVAAAGDGGPGPATVAVPGDVPELLTVGAAVRGEGGWDVAPRSAAGPGFGGYVKPELLAPVVTVAAPAGDPAGGPPASTAGAAAVAGGVAALLVQAQPWLSPDEVKQRLLVFARPVAAGSARDRDAVRHGAGVVDAPAAIGGPALPAGGSGEIGRGLVWADGAGRGMVWSDRAGRGMFWSHGATRGMVWSDSTAADPLLPMGGASGMAGSSRAGRGLTWSD